ncbi:MAG TPA: AAA family ATPase [Nakamurella sp.]
MTLAGDGAGPTASRRRHLRCVARGTSTGPRLLDRRGQREARRSFPRAFAHGFRWDRDGVWTRLQPGDTCPLTGAIYNGPDSRAKLHPGDVLVVDEAGMLDQQTAQALLHIADEADARIVYLGDRHQLPAVGRGGVLDMVAAWSRTALELSAVHRFLTPEGTKDTEYADLSLRIRTGVDPKPCSTSSCTRATCNDTDTDTDALAAEAAQRHLDGDTQSGAVDTNEAADAVNEVVRERLVDAGLVDDQHTVHGRDGLRIGAGDRVVTRENDNRLGVANRMTWTVAAVQPDGALELTRQGRPDPVALNADYVRENIHLAYASTVHGVQGETSDHGRLHLTDLTDAAALYVGMTRGRRSNTVHIVARTYDQAREQWVAASGRDRADLGVDQARATATAEAANYAPEGQGHPRTGRREGARSDRTNFGDRLNRVNSQLQEQGSVKPADCGAPISDDVDALRNRGVRQHPRGPRR